MKKISIFLIIVLCEASSLATTIAQWDFEDFQTQTVNISGSDYSVTQAIDESTMGNNLNLGAAVGNISTPFMPSTIPTVATGYKGNGLSFDGVANEAIALGAWKSYSTMSVDFWYKSEDAQSGVNELVEATSVWAIYITASGPQNNKLFFTTWNAAAPNGDTWMPTMTLFQNVWYHVIASVDINGLKTLAVYEENMSIPIFNETHQVYDWQGIPLSNKNIVLGNKPFIPNGRYFKGIIDEVVITPEPTTILLVGLGCLLLKRRKVSL